MFKKYFNYFKNNPEGYWFKKKLFGWGWTPAKWQGWLVVAIFLGIVVWIVSSLSPEPTSAELNLYFIKLFLVILALLVVCYTTGEKPSWQWGLPKDGKK